MNKNKKNAHNNNKRRVCILMKENKDKEYDFKYDESKKLVEQDIYNQTKDFLSIIYIVYICNKTEKTKLLESYKETNEEIEKQKKLKYQREKLFQKEVNKENDEEETALVEGHESFWTIFINKIKNFFKKS